MNEATLRDVLAASAMQGWLSSWPVCEPHPAGLNTSAELLAKQSYAMADAMLAERAKGLK